MKPLHALLILLLYPACLYGQQTRDSWAQLKNDLDSRNDSALPGDCRELIVNEGVDIRTLLSILRSNEISLRENWIPEMLDQYNRNKRAFFQTRSRFCKIDSLFTEAFIFHRNHVLRTKHRLKDYERAPLAKLDSRIAAKYKETTIEAGYYDYLKEWIAKPNETEEEVICSFVRRKGITLDGLLSYHDLNALFPHISDQVADFDAAFQKKITTFRTRSIVNERSGNIKLALQYRDSISISYPLLKTSDGYKAKLLAMKARVKDEYLRCLTSLFSQSMNARYFGDTMRTFGRTQEDVAFVKLALKGFDIKGDDSDLPAVSYDLLMLSDRYTELHDFAASFAYPRKPLFENKNRKARLFVDYVKESFTEYPNSIRFLTRSALDFNREIQAASNYVTIHMLQYNFREHLTEESAFESFLSVNAMLVNMKVLDAEDYFWLLDCYNTAVRHRESQYGWKLSARRDETIVINELTKTNREKNFLLPIEYLEN